MRSIVRAGVLSTAAAGMLVAGGMTASASAQPIALNNLVNVQISNVLNDNEVVVSVPINAAAAICGVDVDVLVLAQQAGDVTSVTCDARGDQQVEIVQ